jgi:hypothetical protein
VDAQGNDGNASMPEQINRPNPRRKMMMMMMMIMILENTPILSFMTIRPAGAEFFHTEGQT